jgi:hypothetical protein
MKIRWPWQRKKENEDLDSVESLLESLFTPVPVRPAFMEDLRQRLVGKPGPLAAAGRSTLQLILMIGGGLVGLIVFIFAGFRAIITLITGIRLMGSKVKETRTERKRSEREES